MSQNARNKELVRWSESGDTLIITDINTFSDKILPEYFNHSNYSSFIRQLNMYGFRKENKEKKTKQEEYKHEFFRRGCKDLLKSITRKKRGEDEAEDRLQLHISARHGRPRPPSVDSFDEGVFVKPEILRDHEDLAKRVHNLMKGYEDLDREKDGIRKTLDKVNKDVEELKGEYTNQLDLILQFLSMPPGSFVKGKTAGQGLGLLLPVVQGRRGVFEGGRVSGFSLPKHFLSRGEALEPTKISYRHMNGSCCSPDLDPKMIDWEQSSVDHPPADLLSTRAEVDQADLHVPLERRDSLGKRGAPQLSDILYTNNHKMLIADSNKSSPRAQSSRSPLARHEFNGLEDFLKKDEIDSFKLEED